MADSSLQEHVEDSQLEAPPKEENLFEPLVPEARSVLRQVMLNSKDKKLAVSTAESVLDRAGETKKGEQKASQVVNITDSQVQLLVQTSKEVENEL